jgi:hypothetical protein
MQIVTVPLSAIDDATTNPNQMEPERFELLVASIRRLGFWQPILLRPPKEGRYETIDGHHRARAAREAGMTDVPAVVVPSDVSDADARALMLGMNRLRGELNLATVGDIMRDLVAGGWKAPDLVVTGFNLEEISDLLNIGGDGIDTIMQDAAATIEEPKSPMPVLLEIGFASKDDYQKCRRAIRRAAGKGGELSTGLLRILGEK